MKLYCDAFLCIFSLFTNFCDTLLDPTVRDSASEALGTLMKLVGEKAVGSFLVELEKDNLKMAKIKEFCDKAVIVTVSAQGGKKDRPTTAPSKPPPHGRATEAPKSATAGSKVTKKAAGKYYSLTNYEIVQ